MDNSVSEKDHSPSADSANKQASIESDSLDVKTLELFAQFSASLFSNDLSESQLSPLLAELAAALDADVFTHFIRVPHGLKLAAFGGLPPELVDQLRGIEIGQALCGRSVASAKSISLDAEGLQADPDGAVLYSFGVRCYHVIPLTTNGDCIGSLAFASSQRDHFSTQQKEFMGMVGHVIGASRAQKTVDDLRVVEQERFQHAAEHAKIVVWEANPTTGNITYVSGYCEQLFGYPIEQWYQPRFWHSKVHPDDIDAALQACEDSTKQDLDHRLEYRIICADNTIVWVDDVTTAIKENGDGAQIRGTWIDITHRKSLEAQLLQAQKMEAVGRLAGGIAHDFNNLLTVISTSCDLMLDGKLTTLPGPTVEVVTLIQDAGLRASRLTEQLLLFSSASVRNSDGMLPQSTRSLDVNQAIQSTTQLLQRLLGETITIEVHLAEDLPAARVDPTHLEQIVMNLAVNGRDAMPSGGTLTITTAVCKTTGRPFQKGRSYENDVVQLTVTDTGKGIPEEIKHRIFDPFFTTKEVGQGSGLGLSVVYGIVTKAGGHIEVESRTGLGTEFRIILPSCRRNPTPTVIAPKHQSKESHSEVILLVEDESAVRKLISKALGMKGYHIIEMPDAASALNWAQSNAGQVDLLLTDVIMPKMTGPELANTLVAIDGYQDLPVLYLSGYAGREIEKHGVYSKTHNFLQKPFSIQSLINKVRETLDQSAAKS